MKELIWLFKSYNELTASELYDIYYLRQEVFVVEQKCAYQDIDGNDQSSYHIMAYYNKVLVAYLRIVNPGVLYIEASIGRVVVKYNYRGKGLARELTNMAIEKIKLVYDKSSIRISAQQYLVPFYKSLNFRVIGNGYLEDNIPHIEMLYVD